MDGWEDELHSHIFLCGSILAPLEMVVVKCAQGSTMKIIPTIMLRRK